MNAMLDVRTVTDQVKDKLTPWTVGADRIPAIEANLRNPQELVRIYRGSAGAHPEGDQPFLWHFDVVLNGKSVLYSEPFQRLEAALNELEPGGA